MLGKRENATLIAVTLSVLLALAACGTAAPDTSGAVPLSSAPPVAGTSIAPSPAALSASTGRPSPSGTAAAVGKSSAPAKRPPTPPPAVPAPNSIKHVFPVSGGPVSYAHTHHDYPATDVITACGNTVRAATSGVILEVTRVDKWKASVNAGATRGGLSISIKGDDGIRYYGSHLEEINQNIHPGVRVTAGEPMGKVGRSGDAGACHLHFGLSPVCKGVGDWWIQRGVTYPWSFLDSWRKGGNKSPVAAVDAWQKKYGCPSKPLVDP